MPSWILRGHFFIGTSLQFCPRSRRTKIRYFRRARPAAVAPMKKAPGSNRGHLNKNTKLACQPSLRYLSESTGAIPPSIAQSARPVQSIYPHHLPRRFETHFDCAKLSLLG